MSRNPVLFGYFYQPVAAHVKFASLVIVSQQFHHLSHVHQRVRLDRERDFVHIVGQIQRRSKGAENVEFPLPEVLAAGIFAVYSLPVVEPALSVPEPVVQKNLLEVVGGEEVPAVAAVNAAYARDVGGDSYVIVRNTLRYPGCALVMLAVAGDFELPDLILVRNGEAFARVAVTQFLCEPSHQQDCIAGIVASLKGKTA